MKFILSFVIGFLIVCAATTVTYYLNKIAWFIRDKKTRMIREDMTFKQYKLSRDGTEPPWKLIAFLVAIAVFMLSVMIGHICLYGNPM